MSWNKMDIALWLLVLFLIALIMGLYQAEGHKIPPKLFDRTKANTQSHQLMEGFETSSAYDISGGASSNYGYKYTETDKPELRPYRDDYERQRLRGEILPSQFPQRRCNRDDPNDTIDCYRDDDRLRDESCRRCDILMNDDLPKYVLKSSVPPMPDMSQYIKKSEIPACRNENVNLDDYIHKSKIPTKLGECPTCPICPPIPDDLKKGTQNISEFNIVSTDDIDRLLQDARVKAYLDQKYSCKKDESKSIMKELSAKIFPESTEEETAPQVPPATEEERVRPTMQIVKKKKPASTSTSTPNETSTPAENNFIQRIWNSFLSLFGVKESYENENIHSAKIACNPNNKNKNKRNTDLDVYYLTPPANMDTSHRLEMIYNSRGSYPH